MKKISKTLGSLTLIISCLLFSPKSFAKTFNISMPGTQDSFSLEIPEDNESKRKFIFAIRNKNFDAVQFFRALKFTYIRSEYTNEISGVAGVELNDNETRKLATIHSIAIIKTILETGSGQILAYNAPLLINLVNVFNYNLPTYVATILDFLELVERPANNAL